eukprot:Hpha_TRINITY_DN8845_c0_g1::TRINITY_DN8845_c0_g1_i1::g.141444::m.141444/K19603/MAPK15; mitogen-activated protein kinase 15
MVGFGDFLRKTCERHAIVGRALDYGKLKRLLESLTNVTEKESHEPAVRLPTDSLPSRQFSAPTSSPTHEHDSESNRDGSARSSPLGSPLRESAQKLSADDLGDESEELKPGHAKMSPGTFVHSLEKELRRLDNVIAAKLMVTTKRAHGIVETAKALRQRRLTHELGISITQIALSYDDVMMLLWFMYLNAIGVSKIVKKYNKNVPSSPYLVKPQDWMFLSGGLLHAQTAKASLESEYITCLELRNREITPGSLVDSSAELRSLATEITKLMAENAKHLNLEEDQTSWACKPLLDTGIEVSAEMQRRKKETENAHLKVRRYTVTDPRICGKYLVDRIVGRGAYGTVCRLVQRSNRSEHALKTIMSVWSHPVMAQRTYREVLLMVQLEHPYILGAEDVVMDINDSDVHIVMPFVGYTLETLLSAARLQPVHKRWFSFQLVEGINYLHFRGVVHRDLKPPNLLVTKKPQLLISDFGLARSEADPLADCCSESNNPEYAQTQWYRAPEVLMCQLPAAGAADIWSVGCIIVEMQTGIPLFPGQDCQHQLELIHSCFCDDDYLVPVHHPNDYKRNERARRHRSEDDRAAVPRAAPLRAARRNLSELISMHMQAGNQRKSCNQSELPAVISLATGLLMVDPERRLSAASAAEHSWFADLQSSRLPLIPPNAPEPEPVRLPISCKKLVKATDYKTSLRTTLRLRKEDAERKSDLMSRQRKQIEGEAKCDCVIL